MDGLTILKHEKGYVYLLETKPTKIGIPKLKSVLKDINPQVVAVELCLTKLEDLKELKKLDHQIPLHLIPNRLLAKAKQERDMLELLNDAIAHNDSCRLRKAHRAKMISLHVAPAMLQNLLTDRVLTNQEICKDIRTVFETATIWHLDTNTFKYLTSQESSYKIMLADRPYEDVVCDIIDAMSDEEKKIVNVYAKNFRKLFVSNHSTRTVITNLLQRNSKLKRVIVDKRDEYLVNSFIEALDIAAKQPGSKRVLALVRKSRIKGVIKYWNSKMALEAKLAKKPADSLLLEE